MANKKIKISGRASGSSNQSQHTEPLSQDSSAPLPEFESPVPQNPDPGQGNQQNNSGFLSQKRALTREVTNLIAAKIIADSDFPNEKTLPRFYPTPFNNFGHYYLFDYEKMLKIVWDAVAVFKSHLTPMQRITPWIVLAGGLILFFIYAGAVDIYDGSELLGPLFAVLFLFLVTKSVIRQQLAKKFADFRAECVGELLDDRWRPSMHRNPGDLERNLMQLGSGKVEGGQIPVVVIFNDRHPFPGYGRLQLTNMFICRPEKGKEVANLSMGELFERITGEIKEDMEGLGLENFNTGHIISVHSQTLKMDSNWLDRQKVPHLYFDAKNKFNHHLVDKNASSRLFFVVQSVMPEYMTASSFFVRFFKAENSLGCQISVTTLGPPDGDRQFLLKRLAKYRAEVDDEKNILENLINFLKSMLPIPRKVMKMKLFQELKKQISNGKDRGVFRKNIKLREVRKMDLLDEKLKGHRDYHKLYDKVVNENVMWQGRFYYSENYREENSLTFTSDYYGNPEATGSVRSVYDQISRSVLDAFENIGYDISEYKDQQGNYSINADKIDQLVVGEKIQFKQEKKEPDSKKSPMNSIASITRRAKKSEE